MFQTTGLFVSPGERVRRQLLSSIQQKALFSVSGVVTYENNIIKLYVNHYLII